MTKGIMPTHGEVIASGKRVLIFLEKDEHKTVKPNYETGLYPQGLVMTQKCFMARTLWNRAYELMNPKIAIESSLVTADFVHLPPSNFFVMIDYYTTVLGAKYDDLVDLHTNLFQKMDSIFARIRTYLGCVADGAGGAARGGAGGSAPLPPKICPPAYMFMVDFISPEIITMCIDRTISLLGRRYNRSKRLTRNRAILERPEYTPVANGAVKLAKGFANRVSAMFRATHPAEHHNVVTVKNLEELSPIESDFSQEELNELSEEELRELRLERYMLTPKIPRFKILNPTEISKELKRKIKKIELKQQLRGWKLLPLPLHTARMNNLIHREHELESIVVPLSSRNLPPLPDIIIEAEEYLKDESVVPALKGPIRSLVYEYRSPYKNRSRTPRLFEALKGWLARAKSQPPLKKGLRRRTRKNR